MYFPTAHRKGIDTSVSESGEVLAKLGRFGGGVEFEGPGEVEVGACLGGGAGEAGVVDVVMDDEDTAGGSS